MQRIVSSTWETFWPFFEVLWCILPVWLGFFLAGRGAQFQLPLVTEDVFSWQKCSTLVNRCSTSRKYFCPVWLFLSGGWIVPVEHLFVQLAARLQYACRFFAHVDAVMHFGTCGPPFHENQLDLGAVHFCARHNSSAQGMQLSLEAGAAVGRGALTHSCMACYDFESDLLEIIQFRLKQIEAYLHVSHGLLIRCMFAFLAML